MLLLHLSVVITLCELLHSKVVIASERFHCTPTLLLHPNIVIALEIALKLCYCIRNVAIALER